MEVYAVGDIHGMADVVPKIRRRFEEKLALDPQTYIVFLGDYIDRGGYEKNTLEHLINFQRNYPHNAFFLLGNHDYLMLNALKQFSTPQTLQREEKKNAFWNWWMNGGFTTILSFLDPVTFDSLKTNNDHDALETALSEACKNFLNYICSTEILRFFNSMYGKIHILTRNFSGIPLQKFTLRHAGPEARDEKGSKIPINPQLYDPRLKRIWNKCLPREAMLEEWTTATNQHIHNPEKVNVFGHTPPGRDPKKIKEVIRQQCTTTLRPLDAGSCETNIVAMAPQIQPDPIKVKFIKSKIELNYTILDQCFEAGHELCNQAPVSKDNLFELGYEYMCSNFKQLLMERLHVIPSLYGLDSIYNKIGDLTLTQPHPNMPGSPFPPKINVQRRTY